MVDDVPRMMVVVMVIRCIRSNIQSGSRFNQSINATAAELTLPLFTEMTLTNYNLQTTIYSTAITGLPPQANTQ